MEDIIINIHTNSEEEPNLTVNITDDSNVILPKEKGSKENGHEVNLSEKESIKNEYSNKADSKNMSMPEEEHEEMNPRKPETPTEEKVEDVPLGTKSSIEEPSKENKSKKMGMTEEEHKKVISPKTKPSKVATPKKKASQSKKV